MVLFSVPNATRN